MICKYILDYGRPCCHAPILEKRLRYLPVNTYLYISQTTYVPSTCQLAHYPEFIAQSATLTQMKQGPHKYHTDPADQTHIAGSALRNIQKTLHSRRQLQRKSLHSHIYCTRVTQVDITQTSTHTSPVLHQVARDIALTKEITQSATLTEMLNEPHKWAYSVHIVGIL